VKAALPLALKFVSEQGRMKFVRPLYRYVVTDYMWQLVYSYFVLVYNFS